MGIRRIVMDYAMAMVGVPYKWGGETPMGGMDCSGFAQECLRAAGLQPPQDMTSAQLKSHFHAYALPIPGKESLRDLPPGVLLFFGRHRITHIAVGIGHGLMIEAGGGGSKTITVGDAIRDGAFVRVRPILRRADLVAAADPFRDIDPWCGA